MVKKYAVAPTYDEGVRGLFTHGPAEAPQAEWMDLDGLVFEADPNQPPRLAVDALMPMVHRMGEAMYRQLRRLTTGGEGTLTEAMLLMNAAPWVHAPVGGKLVRQADPSTNRRGDADLAALCAKLAGALRKTSGSLANWMEIQDEDDARDYDEDAMTASAEALAAYGSAFGGGGDAAPVASDPEIEIGIRMEGGAIQSVWGNQPVRVLVIDYDAEDRPEDELFDMPQDDGRSSLCVIDEFEAEVMPDECRRIREARAPHAPEGPRP